MSDEPETTPLKEDVAATAEHEKAREAADAAVNPVPPLDDGPAVPDRKRKRKGK